MSSMKVITELEQDVELIKNCSLPQIVKKDLERFILLFFLGGGGIRLGRLGAGVPF